MAVRSDILADVKGLLGTDPHISDAEVNTLIGLRYTLLYENYLWSRRLRDFTLSMVAQVESGTNDDVTVTLASATVTITAVGTPFTAAMDNRQIVISGINQSFFVNYVSTSQITLEDGEGTAVLWPGATSTTATWRIFQTIYALPSTAEEIISLAGEFGMEEYDGGREALDQSDPYRQSTDSHPRYWLWAGEDSSNVREIEVWPVPTSASLLRGQYARGVPTLADGTYIIFNRALLSYSVAADSLNMLKAKTGDTSYGELALFYERKASEIEPDLKFKDQSRLSLPHSLQQAGSRGLGADFYVSHQGSEEG